MIIHRASMEARYGILIPYFRNKFPECTIHLIYEAGFKGFTLHDRLTEDGIDCVVIPPHLVTEPKVSKIKTDKSDAGLSYVLENHDFKDACHVPDKEEERGPADKPYPRTDPEGHRPHEEQDTETPRLSRDRGLVGRQVVKEGVRALKELPVSEPVKTSLDALLTLFEQLWEHQKTLETSLRVLCRKERYKRAFTLAMSLPGIGWFTAIRLVLEFGEDLSHFSTGKKIASFVGLTCSEHSTGETEHQGRITGMGSGFIRSTLIENSWIACKKDPALLAKFMRVWKSRGSKKKAIMAVARVLIVRLRACLVTGTPYVIGTVR